MTSVQWLICVIASIGFAFDIYELLMLPLVLGPAALELAGIAPGSEQFSFWLAMMFYVPAICGGIFGLLGGYLTDRLGRRFVLTWSIILYAVSAFLAGFSVSLPMLLVLRCTTFIGVCVEFVAAVAWLAELFDDPHRREKVLGYTQAFSSLGGLLVASVNHWVVSHADSLPAIAIPEFISNSLGGNILPAGEHAPWRYTLMSGLIPAIPLILIRPFLPESPKWKEKKLAGTLKRPSLGDLFAPRYFRTTIVTMLMFACSYGIAFGAIQHMPQIVPGFSEVKAAAKSAVDKAAEDGKLEIADAEKLAKEKKRLSASSVQKSVANYTKVQEVGGLIGRLALALLAVQILSRRKLLRVFQIPALFLIPLVFYLFATVENNPFLFSLAEIKIHTFHVLIFLAGFFTVSQFSFWGNYLPLVYPLHLRGTGESFAANIGGRLLGTSFAAVTSFTSQFLINNKTLGDRPAGQVWSLTASGVVLFVLLAGSILCFFLPEPSQQEISE